MCITTEYGEWQRPVVAGTHPRPRYGHTATVVGHNTILVYGYALLSFASEGLHETLTQQHAERRGTDGDHIFGDLHALMVSAERVEWVAINPNGTYGFYSLFLSCVLVWS